MSLPNTNASAHAQHQIGRGGEREGFKLPVVCHGGAVEYICSEKAKQCYLCFFAVRFRRVWGWLVCCIKRSGSDLWLPGGGEPAVCIRLTMAAHKPVEWVQAVINRFDEQVKGQM